MYHELIYHLDLCILSYHQHAQSLIWPFDPYYEQLAMTGSSRRDNFMDAVRGHFANLNAYHGPSDTQGWGAVNPTLDPVMSRYDRLNPWLPAFTCAEPKNWLLYRVPNYISSHIATVHMCHYNPGGNGPDHPGAALAPIAQVAQNPNGGPGGIRTDRLYCFEGGTGSTPGTASNFTLLGCILDRAKGGGQYDVHIAFRGSRSGSGGRAMGQGLLGKGNPDWVTDMDFNGTVQDNAFSPRGEVCRGFSRSVTTAIPAVLACLQAIQAARGQPPDDIYVTGHSLGGALATHFTSAMVVGTTHGPFGANLGALAAWPWRRLRLITYSAPVAGDESFMHNFDSKVWTRRVVLSLDPITQERRHYHVGKEINISGDNTAKVLSYHEPMNVRKRLLRKLGQFGDDLVTVPAQSHVAPDYPWKVYDTFSGLIAGQASLQGPAHLRTLLQHVDTDVQQHYLPILQQIIAQNSSYKTRITDGTRQARQQALGLMAGQVGVTALGGAVGIAAATSLGVRVQNLRQTFDGDLGKFLGFVLILAELAANPQLHFTHVLGNQQLSQCLM